MNKQDARMIVTQLTNLITAFNTVLFVRCFFMLLKHIF